MSKWMSAALVVVSLTGCGLGVPVPRDADGLPQKGAIVEAPAPIQVPAGQAIALKVEGRARVRDSVRGTVKVTNILGAEGRSLSVVIGQMGCGFSVEATGKAIISNGVAQIILDDRLPADMELSVILILDTDGDFKCTAADQLWSGPLVTSQLDVNLSLDVTKLETEGNWMCFAAR